MTDKWFQIIAMAMFGVIVALVGFIAHTVNLQFSDMKIRIDMENSRTNRLNNRMNSVCERIAIVEYQLNMRSGTCTSE